MISGREQARAKRSIDSSEAALRAEVVQLLRFLRVRSNRDKLDECQFLLAGSMLERWKWNSRVIGSEDLVDFLDTIRGLVGEINNSKQSMNYPENRSDSGIGRQP